MKPKRQIDASKKAKLSTVITILLWLSFLSLLFFTRPDNNLLVSLFITNFFLAMLFTLSILLLNTGKGIVISSAITLFLILRIIGIGNILNLILITGIVVAFEFYFRKPS
ncbi:hypothetical protein A3D84_02515 [Candidatus Woesebacteria bacterium RIFCSPHIGHO2_02_FULL_42_20]|uniref:Uncharacterized protein n=1 Tax=Candidatus Woesebacteria bacterium RIFCSPHIGHO2_12_FULL_41_24 TaxID=1802510 RepID=A0A1F8AR74_9BACT|nr:MAG: hypothetical protein A2W15_02710 [Candidatus Woesebacteria bacterium RBG_16_41_13]OGM29218.1 MAG: hypothetical protein A2873_03060 [Candidatus Woesebacteria bacterium RIFCSPHIGHO2_01_FULL_42_80]OGM34716.1 MAG: hypothetical protein A3D84_02515 [Candidatus Woesebacteria bacterium RIFCSPHIGHO2_02_FULL_42_20]OGM53695.1 MAG: hypothetical protein A3E44_02325 [Candidatus Woesebacteria bacterium RIFCSPHIGHO2_12_FULL_41_24]OGM67015.1 MAG: hypothetical protein A2969_05710 [Candidatus Woesebacteri